MKNMAILAVILGILGSTANAESAVSEAPALTLAFNSNTAVRTKTATAINTRALTNEIELGINKTMEQVSIALDKQLEDKITRELEYAMQ